MTIALLRTLSRIVILFSGALLLLGAGWCMWVAVATIIANPSLDSRGVPPAAFLGFVFWSSLFCVFLFGLTLLAPKLRAWVLWAFEPAPRSKGEQ